MNKPSTDQAAQIFPLKRTLRLVAYFLIPGILSLATLHASTPRTVLGEGSASNSSGDVKSSSTLKKFPFAIFSPGFQDPISKMVGLQAGPDGILRQNNCLPGQAFISLRPSTQRDFSLDICEAEVASHGALEVKVNGVTKYLEFGGMAGHYTDFSVSPIQALVHENPYFPIPSNITDLAARYAYPKCDAAAGFVTHQILGSFARDYYLAICLAVRDRPEDIYYSDRYYGGIVSRASDCGDLTASQIHGTRGQASGTPQQDPDLYLCHGRGESNSFPAEVIRFKLLGLSQSSSSSPETIKVLQNGDRIPVSRAPHYSVEAEVAFEGIEVGDDFPQSDFTDDNIPFRIKFEGKKNGAPIANRPPVYIKYAPYTNGTTWDERGIFYRWIGGQDLVGNYEVTATPVELNSDTPVGSSQTIQFELYEESSLLPDRTPPTVPQSLRVTSTSSSTICLAWNASTDPAGSGEQVSGVVGYDIRRGTNIVQTVSSASGCVGGLAPSTSYTFSVIAVDGAGNRSGASSSTTGTTSASSSSGVAVPSDGTLQHFQQKWVNQYGMNLLGARDAQGFHAVNIRSGRNVVYVSSSSGNDANSGLSPSQAVKTISRAHRVVTSSSVDPQAVLLKRGDTWNEVIGNQFRKNGRSANELFYIGSYGDLNNPRPVIIVPDGGNGLNWTGDNNGAGTKNIAILDLEMKPAVVGQGHAIRMVLGGTANENILIENNIFSKFDINVHVENMKNLIISRNILRDSRKQGVLGFESRNQGIYGSKIEGILFSENILFNNGRHLHPSYQVDGKLYSSIFSHNGYFQYTVRKAIMINNISALGGSHGFQMRGGGDLVSNLFLRNPHAAFVGHNDSNFPDPDSNSSMLYNVVLDSYDIHPEVCVGCATKCVRRDSSGRCVEEGPDDVPAQRRAQCLDIKFGINMRVEQNMCLQQKSGTRNGLGVNAFSIDGFERLAQGMKIKNNISYAWEDRDGVQGGAFDGNDESPSNTVEVWLNTWDGPIRNASNPNFNFGTGNASRANRSAYAINPNLNYDLEDLIFDVNGSSNLDDFINNLQSNWDRARWSSNKKISEMIEMVRGEYSELLP